MIKGIFGCKIVYDDEKIIDQKFNNIQDLDKAMRDVKKKFR